MAKEAPVMLDVEGADGGEDRQVRISSPSRVLWPEVGITKLELAQYVLAVRAGVMQALGNRPVTLQRFPDGVDGEAFYSKNPPRGVPAWTRTVPVTYPSGRSHPQLVVDEVATAVWAVQMNTITFHPWPVRSDDTDDPDELRIDLDPQPGRSYADIVEAATLLRDLLAELGITGFAKTSGSRGVHVYARVKPEHEFLVVRHGVIGIGRELERRHPDLVTTAWWKEERGDKIFIDFNQSNRDRTIASAYSPRPLPHAPVSTPVSWAELAELDPKELTVRTVPELVADRGDPWAEIDSTAADLAPALVLWEADLERGLGEMPFPPDFPKMPGEPKRARPSVSRDDTEGIAEREWYADRSRWEGEDAPPEWENRPRGRG